MLRKKDIFFHVFSFHRLRLFNIFLFGIFVVQGPATFEELLYV